MRKVYVLIAIAFTAYAMNAQVGIGTTAPDGSAELDITSTNRGFLMPRVALTATTDTATITGAEATSLLVYNTATVADVTPGFYFWDGTQWVRLNGGAATGNFWDLSGNAGTTPGTNYVGTSDAQDLQLRTNGAQRMTIGATNGNVGIGIAAPGTVRLEVDGGTGDGVFGHSNNVGGYLGRETNTTFGTPPQTLLGAGVYANNPSSGYTSVFAQSTGAADVAANIAFSDVWIASYNYVQNASAVYSPGAVYGQVNTTNSGLTGTQYGLMGYSDRSGVSGNPGFTIGMQGYAVGDNQDSYGVRGFAFSDATGGRAGGYFSGNTHAGTSQAYAYVGGEFINGTNRKIVGTGSVSEVIPTKNHGRITLTAPESPEYWYQDYGTIQMTNGKATIVLDEILADIIIVDENNPIRVICTPVGMPYFNGITIMSQTKNSVELLELNGGTHSGKLQYQLVVKPKTNYGEGRFPHAPGPVYMKYENEPAAALAKNQPNPNNIYRWPADHVVYGYNPEDHTLEGDVIEAGPNAGKVKSKNGNTKGVMASSNPKRK